MTDRDQLSMSFGQAAKTYESGRPDYPLEAVDWMLQPATSRDAPRPRVADVGAGTGKLTRALLSRGADVVAIDPDEKMLDALRESVRGVPALRGTGELLPLADASVDAAVFGQAWHWVEPDAASREVARVLRPGGVLGLVWNIRDESVPWVARLTRIMRGSHAEEMLAEGPPPVRSPFGIPEEASWEWARPVTRSTLTAMVASRSYIITAAAHERARIERECAQLFDEIGARGEATVDLPYVTRAFRVRRP